MQGRRNAAFMRKSRHRGWKFLTIPVYKLRMTRDGPAMEFARHTGKGSFGSAEEWLASGALRPTRQRLALANLLIGDGENRHVTAESLHEAASAAKVPVSLATVYNTLRAFCDAGLMHEITVDGTRSYFDTRIDDHPHYFWEDDSRLSDAPNDAVHLSGEPAIPDGATLSRVDVIIRLRKTSQDD